NTAQTFTGALTLSNTGNAFTGNGSGLTNLNASNLVGSIFDSSLSPNVALRSAANTFSSDNTFLGSIGIGAINNTGARLLVRSSTGGSGGSTVHADNTSPAGIAGWFTNNSTDGTIVLTQAGSGALIRAYGPGAASPNFVVGNNGSVGINTDSPQGPLD